MVGSVVGLCFSALSTGQHRVAAMLGNIIRSPSPFLSPSCSLDSPSPYTRDRALFNREIMFIALIFTGYIVRAAAACTNVFFSLV